LYGKMAKENARLRQLKAAADHGAVIPNIPQMGRFFTSVEAAPEGRAPAEAALKDAAAASRNRLAANPFGALKESARRSPRRAGKADRAGSTPREARGEKIFSKLYAF
jgi:hypothetical protein